VVNTLWPFLVLKYRQCNWQCMGTMWQCICTALPQRSAATADEVTTGVGWTEMKLLRYGNWWVQLCRWIIIAVLWFQGADTTTRSLMISPSKLPTGRKSRNGDVRKCRKVYGIENRSLWCTQCKWKKACTRFSVDFCWQYRLVSCTRESSTIHIANVVCHYL